MLTVRTGHLVLREALKRGDRQWGSGSRGREIDPLGVSLLVQVSGVGGLDRGDHHGVRLHQHFLVTDWPWGDRGDPGLGGTGWEVCQVGGCGPPERRQAP